MAFFQAAESKTKVNLFYPIQRVYIQSILPCIVFFPTFAAVVLPTRVNRVLLPCLIASLKTFSSGRTIEEWQREQSQPLLQPVLQDHERQAVNELLQYLESSPLSVCLVQRAWISLALDRPDSSFFEGEPLRVLRTLSFSDHPELQKSAALAFAEVTERRPFLSLLGFAM